VLDCITFSTGLHKMRRKLTTKITNPFSLLGGSYLVILTRSWARIINIFSFEMYSYTISIDLLHYSIPHLNSSCLACFFVFFWQYVYVFLIKILHLSFQESYLILSDLTIEWPKFIKSTLFAYQTSSYNNTFHVSLWKRSLFTSRWVQ